MTDTMLALTFDSSREDWKSSRGLVKESIETPRLDDPDGADRSNVIVKVRYSGFCGSDRGIWTRKAFGDMILGSLAEEHKTKRVVGHEFMGEIVEVGPGVAAESGGDAPNAVRGGYKPGLMVSTESHVVCGVCYQCVVGDNHVCARDKIIGISRDGCFAEYIKMPAKSLWPTRLDRIKPEIAAIQEPFGNAVHACQVVDLKGKTVAVIGCGTIGMFAILIARGMGAKKIIGVDVVPQHLELAKTLGCDAVLQADTTTGEYKSDPRLREKIRELTDGVGVDVALEMAGFNTSINNAIKSVRRGGHVILFGVKNGDAVVEDIHRVVMDGIQLHGVVGRRIFATWEITRRLLEDRSNGIADAMWNVILRAGNDTVVDIRTWTFDDFERRISAHPKLVLKFAG
jgi:threonine 3-dehydrogenase